ncbi:MAG: hypothetical protein UX04_C0003G0001 [Microgenomates group bacterium GW2011_GWF2_45_18]|nr:MAG: hypothetical protein UW18_C0002G0001 [Microgenomates group bacterium GW2011_GWF1_44_10]KKU01729.1 MAG: hypothetical protein UX04_C0003G0001 [Microgenomates group bacterium GW2011_GWF2_45_18]OGJ40042.1 MAG: hypothetical protein A2378_02735 [Candidatus Pacebacteria bacterium RIFOXYB1_FULL_44_10]HAX01073.1 hypothetical protein [Candidatus Paceibacterota bacterium]
MVDLIVIDSDKSSAIAQIRFDELSPRNQSERLRVILSDYLFTVMSRAETMHLDGLVLDFVQYYALNRFSLIASRIRRKLTVSIISDSSIFDAGDLGRALNKGLDATNTFIGNFKFIAQLSPLHKAIQDIQETHDQCQETQLTIAMRVHSFLLRKYPLLEQTLDNRSGRDPGQVILGYFTETGEEVPEHLNHLAYFHFEIRRLLNKDLPEEVRMRAWRESHLKMYPTMDLIYRECLSEFERDAVQRALEYGDSLELTSIQDMF